MRLTTDQCWLLAVYDPSMLADLILTPEYGLSRIKSTCAGGTACHPNRPEWLRWYDTGGGIHGSDRDNNRRVSISYGQLTKWAASVPADIRAKIEANHAARVAERERTRGWCRCPWQHNAPNSHSQPCARYHPTDGEDQAHATNELRTHAYMKVFIGQAIWAETKPAQLDLFAEDASGTA